MIVKGLTNLYLLSKFNIISHNCYIYDARYLLIQNVLTQIEVRLSLCKTC